MFYRRKILLALIQLFHGRLEKISLQKFLFLSVQKQIKPEFDFIPYKYGCYSYSASADLAAMVRNGQLTDDISHFIKKDKGDYLNQLRESDRDLVIEVGTLYGHLSSNELMKYTYLRFPFYAINSKKAPELLNEKELEKIEASRPSGNSTILFTIGYEGISLEEYLKRLLQNDVKLLVDVRNNPLSMKFGFSKNQLKKYCESLGINYIHFPEVGIQSDKRQQLNSQVDYDRLFSYYKKENLPKTKSAQIEILNLLKENKRIALTCFEANTCQCHRTHLAESIAKLKGFEYEIKHI